MVMRRAGACCSWMTGVIGMNCACLGVCVAAGAVGERGDMTVSVSIGVGGGEFSVGENMVRWSRGDYCRR